jgi:hypothetical protein
MLIRPHVLLQNLPVYLLLLADTWSLIGVRDFSVRLLMRACFQITWV